MLSTWTGEILGFRDGIRSIENKKFPTARTNNKPRSNLVDGSNEVKMNIPSKIAKR